MTNYGNVGRKNDFQISSYNMASHSVIKFRICWVNIQCRGVLLIWIRVGQGPTALAVGEGVGLFGHFFSRLSFLFSFSLFLGDGPI